MSEGTTGGAEVIRLRQSIETQMRRRILEAIEVVLEEELTVALGTGRYERGDARRGYRNGHQRRRITTVAGDHDGRGGPDAGGPAWTDRRSGRLDPRVSQPSAAALRPADP